MTPIEYKQFCESTYAAPEGTDREEYLRLLLIEELGEVASLFAKAMRDGVRRTCTACGGHGFVDNIQCNECDRGGVTTYGPDVVDRDALLKELGDVMWCAAMLNELHPANGWKLDTQDFITSNSSFLAAVLKHSGCEFTLTQQLCNFHGFTPEEVALANVAKLRRRVADGTIHGAGSER